MLKNVKKLEGLILNIPSFFYFWNVNKHNINLHIIFMVKKITIVNSNM